MYSPFSDNLFENQSNYFFFNELPVKNGWIWREMAKAIQKASKRYKSILLQGLGPTSQEACGQA